MVQTGEVSPALESSLHKVIKKVTEDIDAMKFNTAIASMMAFINEVYDHGGLTKQELEIFAKLLCPFAPHICEEVWQQLGHDTLLSLESWPLYDAEKTIDETVEIALQVNGKFKGTMILPQNLGKEETLAAAKKDERLIAASAGKIIVKEIVVPNKIVNIVVK